MGRFANNVKTVLLLGLIMGLAIVIGRAWFGPMGILYGLLFGGVANLFAYYFSDKIALASMGAQEVSEEDAPELVGIVRELANNAGLPMPRVYVSPHEAPNAFATGRNPSHAAVCVTHGLLATMPARELRGVLGHELAHVRNRDILITTIAATFAGAITAIASMARWGLILGGFGRGSDREEGNPLAALLLIILAPIAALLIQMWISRTREYNADSYGAQLAGDPLALANALRRLEHYNRQIPMDVNPAREGMFIVSPFSGQAVMRLFSTHPPLEDRIRRLEAMAARGF
ncbi:MAG TPA: zinc metalloprotease HtpX [Phycisphaerae bacterium]|nr:zinc metalloprotease HtpX [Phycisphaerae bacterium]